MGAYFIKAVKRRWLAFALESTPWDSSELSLSFILGLFYSYHVLEPAP